MLNNEQRTSSKANEWKMHEDEVKKEKAKKKFKIIRASTAHFIYGNDQTIRARARAHQYNNIVAIRIVCIHIILDAHAIASLAANQTE